jgi:hypothetical protein
VDAGSPPGKARVRLLLSSNSVVVKITALSGEKKLAIPTLPFV